MAKTVVVDSDAIYAIYIPKDPLNSKATKTFQKLIENELRLVYPTSVLFESISLFQRASPLPEVAEMLADMIKNDELQICVIDNGLLKASINIFKAAGSKKNTLVDCSVVAVSKRIKADGVFAYDRFYLKQGLKQAEDLI
ncbi:MAG: PIN domain-containing protein [Patescibacteria group bacterium]